ncbi:MAG: 50S ribosomal protein L25 [Planctomycetota bacterium]
MEWVKVQVNLRDKKGTSNCQRMRKGGQTPAVLYGRKEQVQMLVLDEKEAAKLLSRHTHLVSLEFPKGSEKVVVKEIKYDGLKEKITHIDFVRIAMDEMLSISIDIILKGHPKGITDGGVLEQNLRTLNVKCLPTAIPEKIEVDVANLELGGLIRVKDIKLPKGVTAATDGEVVIAGVHKPKEEIVEPTPLEGAAAEPEVIVKKKEVEGEETAETKGADKAAPVEKKPAAAGADKASAKGKEEKK